MSEKEKPMWPSDLPEPIEIGKAVKRHHTSPDEFGNSKDIIDLVHDMHWFPDDEYYLFTKVKEGIDQKLLDEFSSKGIEIGPILRCFYPHPNPSYKNNFVHIPPESIKNDWHREASKKQEYTRFTLSLAPWKRKEEEVAEVVRSLETKKLNNSGWSDSKKWVMGIIGTMLIGILGWLGTEIVSKIWRCRTASYQIGESS